MKEVRLIKEYNTQVYGINKIRSTETGKEIVIDLQFYSRSSLYYRVSWREFHVCILSSKTSWTERVDTHGGDKTAPSGI